MAPNSPGSAEPRPAVVTRRFRVSGIVQGVGFRPFVHRLARDVGARGWVLNDSQGVLLELQAPGEAIEAFLRALSASPPPLARITGVREEALTEPAPRHADFHIRKSVDLRYTDTLIPPDSDVCAECLREMRDPANRRYRYPFINCTHCGPRYSIICDMPYDRPQTTMQRFAMCPACAREYEDIDDRRYHAQPNACPACGPRLTLTDRLGAPIAAEDPVRFAIARLREGALFAVKSLGGFHLVADARNEAAVKELRRRKRRDAKPFAVMVADGDAASRHVVVSAPERALLESRQRPIVLLRKRPGALPEAVAPRNPSFGVMLPSTPLHYLLLEDPALDVLIMTSGNLSGHPIAYDNDTALSQLRDIADYFVLHDRDIRTRVDDSVVRLTEAEGLDGPLLSFIRRSRGYAPYPIHMPEDVGAVVALGGELKTTVAVGKDRQVFISQHIGDLKNDATFSAHVDCSTHVQRLLSVQTDTVACDMHPAFRSTRAAKQQAGAEVVTVQHHHAHMAACMAENGLSERVIGVIFDGSGYGLDNTIWGGEFLVGDHRDFERAGHLRPMVLLGGDKAVKEPIRVAISLLVETFGDDLGGVRVPALQDIAEERRDVFVKMAQRRLNATATTSMGRLFDGVSSLLRICHEVEYEAQAAIEMEALLERDFRTADPLRYDIEERDGRLIVDYRPLVRDLLRALEEPDATPAHLSRRFHSTVVDVIAQVCRRLAERYDVRRVVMSGGVFMNEFVLINAIRRLGREGLTPYCHRLVPSNDGGLSLGQILVAAARAGSAPPDLPTSAGRP
ncbi:hydrogenase maturation protein HypF [Sorangium cellulosum]|uniref:Carbamoyltransferase n=1 Tax=Sorangium cellulosum TaxID=56 RepID=A0A4P2PXL8_SORCE|nr:carbamoyltransferase HypF [Sorangium cellulosum]AUX21615.1 hydrogenase maturation protein HypF [Sorangium cellulosum]